MDLDDLVPKKESEDYEIGTDLSKLSVEELEALIGKLESEIQRVKDEIEAKNSVKSSADAVFKKI